MTDDEQDLFNKSIGKLEEEIIALKKEYQAECNRADELEDSLQTSWQNESKLQKQLEIAIKALEFYEKPFACFHPEYNITQHHKKAVKALAKIKEIK